MEWSDRVARRVKLRDLNIRALAPSALAPPTRCRLAQECFGLRQGQTCLRIGYRSYMKKRRHRAGDSLFRKGDSATEMFLSVGELALLTPGYQRTQTVECVESGHVLTLPYDEVRALYFENPEFGFYFLQLASGRLLEAVARAEEMLGAENVR